MSMSKILPFKDGAPISIYEVIHYSQYKHNRECKDDVLSIIYKDPKGEKKVQRIKNPPMEIFFTKPEHRTEWNTPREYIEMDKVYPVKVDAKRVVPTIYQEMKHATDSSAQFLKKVYNDACDSRNFGARKEILKWPHVFMADLQPEEYYRIQMGYHYDLMHGHTIDKCFLDIESDIFGMSTSQTQNNEDRTNACTLIFRFDKDGAKKDQRPIVLTFLLRDHKKYPQQAHFEKNLDKFIKQCHAEFDIQQVIKKGKKKDVDVTSDYQIMLYDDEADLLQSIFVAINHYKPDLCEVWNIAYDLPKLRARLEANGINHVDVMSDAQLFAEDERFVDITVDDRPEIDIADRKTFIKMTSTTKYVDQMQSYASIRKGRKAYGSNKLDNIAKIELGMGKREFAKGIDVTNAAIKDYWNFVLYNIRDVWCQVLIDEMTNDSMTLIYDQNQSQCAIENLTKQTRYQKQIYYTWYLRKGFVPGNNPNTDYVRARDDDYQERLAAIQEAKRRRMELDGDWDDVESDDSEDDVSKRFEVQEVVEKGTLDIYCDSINRKLKLQGGLVGHPNLNSANGTELVSGVPSKHVYDEVMDMDFAAEYPWIKFTRSVSKSTQYGRLIIHEKISDRQNTFEHLQSPEDREKYSPGAEFVSDYISQDFISLGNTWFGLPSVAETLAMLEDS